MHLQYTTAVGTDCSSASRRADSGGNFKLDNFGLRAKYWDARQ